MKTHPSKLRRERDRKKRIRKRTRTAMQAIKQALYWWESGRWEKDPTKLHWHHVQPGSKRCKVSHLHNRHYRTVLQEASKCEIRHESEHRLLHSPHLPKPKK